MNCSDCGFDNREGIKFCTNCGTPLFLLCPKCGSGVIEEDAFCGNCGIKLLAQVSLPTMQQGTTTAQPIKRTSLSPKAQTLESERKHVTVMFADMSGFTEISETMDPEDVTNMMNAYLKMLADIVLKYEGYIDKFIGDCVMAIFGAPVAHENDPELAVLAALEMISAMENPNFDLPVKIDTKMKLHIGLNSGMVIAGGVGSDQKMDYTVMGDTVNLASRLESKASHGQIFLSNYTYNLTKNLFEFIEHEPIKVKGKRDPVAVYEVVRAKAHREKGHEGVDFKTPFVGRTQEFKTLKTCVDRLLSSKNENQVVFLISDAGIGKSRIQFELQEYLKDKNIQTVQGVCHSYSQTTSYYLFSELFKALFDIESDDLTDTMSEKLSANLPVLLGADSESLTPEIKDAIVFIGSILGLDLGDEYDIPLKEMNAQDIKFSIFKSIKWFFEQMSDSNPLILSLEDLHYANSVSLELITYLFETIQDKPIMLLLSLRQVKGYSASKLSLIAKKNVGTRHTEIVCQRFNSEESDELVRKLLKTENVPEAVLSMIRTRADGSPFYIEEILRDILENEVILVDNGTVKIMKDLEQVSIPDTLHGMIVSRIDKLDNDLKDILQAASVIGPVFKLELLKNVIKDRKLEENLERLAETEMIFESKSFPEIEYSFKNILTQEAAYSGLLLKKQRNYHQIVADEIEKLYKDRLEEYSEILTMHYSNAKDFSKAYHYHVKSGIKAQKIFANEDAITHFFDAVSMSKRVENPEVPAVDLYISLSEIYELTGDLDKAIDARKAAIELLDDKLRKADSMRNVGRILEKKGNPKEALQAYEEVYKLLKNNKNSLEMGRLLMNQSWVLNRMKNYKDALDKCSQALEIFESKDKKKDIAQAHNNLAVVFESKGDFDLALEHNEKSMNIFSELNDKRNLGNIYLSLGFLYQKRKDLDGALEYFEKSLEAMDKIGNRYGTGTALMSKGRTCVNLGRMDEAETSLLHSLRIHKELNIEKKILQNEVALSNVYIQNDNLESAREHISSAQEIASTKAYKPNLAEIAHLEANLLIKEGNKPDEKFQESIYIYESIGRKKDADRISKEFNAYKKNKKKK